jgi:hypothetical protein
MASINKIDLIRLNNPAEPLVAYLRKTESVDPSIVRKIVSTISGRIVKLPNGDAVHKVVFKDKPAVEFYTDDAGKAALGF